MVEMGTEMTLPPGLRTEEAQPGATWEEVKDSLGADPNQVCAEPLHGRTDPLHLTSKQVRPIYVVQKEEPWHRQALELLACGMKQTEVARFLGKQEHSIAVLKRTPWFQARLLKLTEEKCGSRDILELMKAEVLTAFQTQLDIMEDKEAPAAVRAKIADSMLDRVYGKARQTIEVSNGGVTSADPVAEAARLEEENQRLREGQP